MADADAVGVAGNPANGPFMVLYLRLDGDLAIDAALGGLPVHKRHCSALAAEALQRARAAHECAERQRTRLNQEATTKSW